MGAVSPAPSTRFPCATWTVWREFPVPLDWASRTPVPVHFTVEAQPILTSTFAPFKVAAEETPFS